MLEPLAIVGMGCRFPGGVNDPVSYWDLLLERRSGIVEAPPDRWDRDRFHHPDPEAAQKMVTKRGGFVEGLDLFDARFFGISPREAMRMDPQQRWLLEVSWEALEDAGIPPSTLRRQPVGVFVGISTGDYAQIQNRTPLEADVHTTSGSAASIAANRISFLFDFTGPSLSVDTACSSSLVAVHLGAESIWRGHCRMALAGGVNAMIGPDPLVSASKAGMLSPTGQSLAFDARADGYVRGEGAGMVVLKPWRAAVAAGDRIYALLAATAVNQDGHTAAMTAPSAAAQAAMMRRACEDAGILPDQIAYVEAHGTGTPVGDPIEAEAIGSLTAGRVAAGDACLMGSVKTALGHLEAAAGVAGLIKAALVLHHGIVPPVIGFAEPNPRIAFGKLGLRVVTEATALPSRGGAPAVLVNSFGFGGTNATAVLRSAPPAESRADVEGRAPRPLLLPLSARSADALRGVARSMRRFLKESEAPVEEICFNAATRRDPHAHRLVVLGRDSSELREALRLWLTGQPTEDARALVAPPASDVSEGVVFVFTGQGGQWWGMGRELLETEPLFRRALEEMDGHIRRHAGWSLLEEMARPMEASQLGETRFGQPALFALQMALVELWASFGIKPRRVMGHSAGEVAAACVAGIYTLEDAVSLIVHRSRLQARTAGQGRMAAVGVTVERARQAIAPLDGRVEIAAINHPELVTLAGEPAALETVLAALEADGRFVRRLALDHAFHTRQMDPLRDELIAALKSLRPRRGHTPFLSCVTGTEMDGTQLDAGYWWRNVREPVVFVRVADLIAAGERRFLEIGPHPSLGPSIQQCLARADTVGMVAHSLRRNAPEVRTLLENVARLHLFGEKVDWRSALQCGGRFVRLPSYPWQRERFWLESDESRRWRLGREVHPLLGLAEPGPRPTWKTQLDPAVHRYLRDHRLWDSIVFPAVGYAEIGLAVAREIFPGQPIAIERLEMKKALFLPEQGTVSLQTEWDEEGRMFLVYGSAQEGGPWTLHARGCLVRHASAPGQPVDLDAIKARLPVVIGQEEYYAAYLKSGYQFGPRFQLVRRVQRAPGEALAEIVATDDIANGLAAHRCHPALLDACTAAVRASQEIPDDQPASRFFFLPVEIGRVRLWREVLPPRLLAHARSRRDGFSAVVAAIDVLDDRGERVAEIRNYRAEHVPPREDSAGPARLCKYEWRPRRLRGWRTEPAKIAGLDGIAQAVDERLPAIAAKHQTGRHASDFVPRLEAIFRQAIENALVELHWDPEVGASVSFDDFARQAGIVPEYRRMAQAQMDDLVVSGLLARGDTGDWIVRRRPVERPLEPLLNAAAADFPEFAAEIDLHRATMPLLGAVLGGEVDPAEHLLAGPWRGELSRFRQGGADFAAAGELIREAVAAAVLPLQPGQRARVLEIGLGAGDLAREIARALPVDRTDYVCAGMGPVFMEQAKKRAAAFPTLESIRMAFDVASDRTEIPQGDFDLVIISHARFPTARLAATMMSIRHWLAPGGAAMFLGMTVRRAALETAFAMLPGGNPMLGRAFEQRRDLLALEAWDAAVVAAGFEAVRRWRVAEGGPSLFVAGAPRDGAPGRRASRGAGGLTWIVPDVGGTGGRIARRLRQEGLDVSIAGARDEPPPEGCQRLVFCPALDAPPAGALTAGELNAFVDATILGLSRIAMAAKRRVNLWVLTRGACRVVAEDALPGIAAAPLAGWLRVLRNERDDLVCRQIDLDPAEDAGELDRITAELLGADREVEVAFRAGERYAARLQRARWDEIHRRLDAATCYRLDNEKPGQPGLIAINRMERRKPGPGEIEVAVRAGGLNFRDLMRALGMYPGTREESEELGNEFAGVITEVGPGSGLEAGRRVMGLVSHAFRSHVLVPADSVVEMPEWMTFEEAATIPTVFLTAHGALVERARLRAGEKALIHAGAGGVDQAAIQVARAHGAIVCATAGSEAKRNHLREQGVEHVFDSRTPDFADALLTVCPGGVDVVLNSLAGELMRRSFSVLAPFGRFIEIGKVDLHADTRIGLRQFRQNAQYHTLDLEEMARHRPDELRRWWREIAAAIASRRYRPLARQKYPITEIAGACRQMAQARHIGKLVLEFPSNPVLAGVSAREGVRFGGNGTYVVAGGNGGFGLEVARWLASRGARHLALLSRSGVRTADALDVVAAMRARGVEVMDLRCDITKAEDVERALASMDAALPPLRGVFHSAMVLDDVFIADMEPAQLHAALDPKMLGAWNLHRATIERPLEWFVCFSSFSALLGMFKQAGYNAGNTFLDALAWHRRALGLPALTVSWGALAGTGFVERNPKTAEFLDRTGMKALPASEALAALDRLMRLDGGHLAVGHVNFADLRRLSSTFADNPVFETVMSMGEETGCATARRRILGAPRDQRLGLMEDFVAAQLAAVFRAEAGRFHRDEKLTEAGLDSLLAVELMVSIESELGITAPMSNLLGGPTVAGLARTLLESLEASAGKGP